MKNNTQKILLGRTDIADFPKLLLNHIDVKIDTGAYTSSLHCHHIEVENNILKCQFLDPNHPEFKENYLKFTEFTKKKVKSSNGIVENRYLIKTEILIFGETYPIDLTLTERGSMRFPVLLGRKFLSKKFIINTSRKNLSYKNKIIKYCFL